LNSNLTIRLKYYDNSIEGLNEKVDRLSNNLMSYNTNMKDIFVSNQELSTDLEISQDKSREAFDQCEWNKYY
jgi:hypothetical protein